MCYLRYYNALGQRNALINQKNNWSNLIDVSDDEDNFKNVQIILVTKMLCSAVDIVCSTGKKWFNNNYTKMLDGRSLNKIDLFQSHTSFKYGDGQKILPEKKSNNSSRNRTLLFVLKKGNTITDL